VTEESSNQQYDLICLTFDVDWACEAVLRHLVTKLETARIKATFFATHQSELLSHIDDSLFEIGLHPNFKDFTVGFEAPVRALKQLYPRAIGGRSHGLFVSSSVLTAYRSCGLNYESNMFLLLHKGLQPTLRFKDLVSIPFYWSDDKHLELGWGYELHALQLDRPGLKVVNFHPIHIFLNTPNPALYERSKTDFHNVDWLRQLQNTEVPGIGTLFDQLLTHLTANGIQTRKMCEIQKLYMNDEYGIS
jgi:hypothetical protein